MGRPVRATGELRVGSLEFYCLLLRSFSVIHHIAVYLLLAAATFFTEIVASQPSTTPESSASAALALEVFEARSLALALRKSANKVDTNAWIGTMYNEVDLASHKCYALGMLIGYGPYVRHLRFQRGYVPVARDSDHAHDLRVQAQSLDNFVSVVEFVSKLPYGQRGITWNLDCSGQYGIAPSLFVKETVSVFYEIVNGGQGLKILGAIEPGFSARLRFTLQQFPNVEFVALGSGGGSISEALTAGRMIRSKGLTTTIWSDCYSACPLVFFGGTERLIHSPYPSLGFHQVYTQNGPLPLNSPVYSQIRLYIREMGVDENSVVAAMAQAGPMDMNKINGADASLCSTRVATWVQRVCSASR